MRASRAGWFPSVHLGMIRRTATSKAGLWATAARSHGPPPVLSLSARALSSKSSSSPSPPTPKPRRNEPRFNYISNPFDSTPDPDQDSYRRVTAKELVNRSSPPRRVKMLVRDFIDDCLYNPNYGYFSTQAVIFDPDQVPERKGASGENSLLRTRAEGFDFAQMRNSREFEDEIARRYGEFEATTGGSGKGPGRQVWHTPTELFKASPRRARRARRQGERKLTFTPSQPWYGRAIARFLVAEYKLNLYPYEDLIIYEIGAGNGTLMGDILDYIAEEEPEVYDRTRYRIVEISERLQGLQKRTAKGGDGKASLKGPAKRKGHAKKVEVLSGSIFDWERVVPEPCFFLALEVLVRLGAFLNARGFKIIDGPSHRTTLPTT